MSDVTRRRRIGVVDMVLAGLMSAIVAMLMLAGTGMALRVLYGFVRLGWDVMNKWMS